MTGRDARRHVGLTCPETHPVFSTVGDRLRERGHAVTYFDPHQRIDRKDLQTLSLLVGKQTRPGSVQSLIDAERLGIRTWNSATGVLACISRFSQLCVLSGVGFPVPSASREKPSGDYVAKRLYHWDMDPQLNGEGDLYEELLDCEPVDFKYYVVDDGETLRTTVLRTTSKLYGEKRVLGEGKPVPKQVQRIRSLMSELGMRAIGVDLLDVGGDWYAVDLNPCPSFAQTGLTEALVESMEASLRAE